MRRVKDQDEEGKGPGDQGTRGRGPEDQGTRRPGDQRTRGPKDQGTKGPEDQGTKGSGEPAIVFPVNLFFPVSSPRNPQSSTIPIILTFNGYHCTAQPLSLGRTKAETPKSLHNLETCLCKVVDPVNQNLI